MCRNVSHCTVIVAHTTEKRSLCACVWIARGRRCPGSSSVASRVYSGIRIDVATGSALKGQPLMGIPLRCCCSPVLGILRARRLLSFAGRADADVQPSVAMGAGVGAFSEAMRALSYRLGALPVMTDGQRQALHVDGTQRGCSRFTSQLVALHPAWRSSDAVHFSVAYTNMLCTRSGLEPAWSARAAAGGGRVPGRGRPLTRWRPPTVQSNAQSSARELENAS